MKIKMLNSNLLHYCHIDGYPRSMSYRRLSQINSNFLILNNIYFFHTLCFVKIVPLLRNCEYLKYVFSYAYILNCYRNILNRYELILKYFVNLFPRSIYYLHIYLHIYIYIYVICIISICFLCTILFSPITTFINLYL